MKNRKIILCIALILVLTLLVSTLASCSPAKPEDVATGSSTEAQTEASYEEMYKDPHEIYEALTSKGYTGTFEEWVASLTGADGKSAYEVAVENGFSGTVEEWLVSLVGATGAEGKSVYDLAVEGGFTGTLEEWLSSLVGATGADGKSAYDLAVEGGYTGTLDEWIASLNGAEGKGIASVEINEEGNIVITYTDDSTTDLGKLESASCTHTYGPWTLGLAATCSSIGYSYRSCTSCSYTEYSFSASLGHSFGTPVTVSESKSTISVSTCILCNLSQVTVEGPKYSEGLDYALTEEEDSYKVTGLGTCTDAEIVIPEEYMGVPVTEISDRAFYGCATIVSVSIPVSVVKIGDKAFSDCPELVNIELPDKIEVGVDVFRGSINVDRIYIHELEYVAAASATCYAPGNIAYYYCALCDEYYADSEGKEKLYDVFIPSTHSFVDGQCTSCGKILDELNIVSVDEISHLGLFPLGTLEDAIGLPESITVYTADGLSHVLPIAWNLSDYVKNTVGDYTIYGHIQPGTFLFEDESLMRVSASVSIVDYMIGTADIVFILDISGSMSDEISHVKNNIETFAQMIADRGVSARWSAITYSDYVEYPYAANEQTQTLLNGTSDWFTNVADYKTTISNIVLAGGGDTPEVAIDALLHANTLSTRTDARVFYILLTDADFKMDNHYDVTTTAEVTDRLQSKNVNASVITSTSLYSTYSFLTTPTEGICADIRSDFAQTLFDSLVPIIYDRVEE